MNKEATGQFYAAIPQESRDTYSQQKSCHRFTDERFIVAESSKKIESMLISEAELNDEKIRALYIPN
ncbi:hypothetical protein [Ascidiimonas sp. W6]|uniref:hypothetical protein n=1 Tax=Ascidiimonas meishanensis TaxID=3128903 RepID=UPI0030EEBF52